MNGTTEKTKVFYPDEKDWYLHIYYSNSKTASEREDLESKIDRIGGLRCCKWDSYFIHRITNVLLIDVHFSLNEIIKDVTTELIL